MYGQVNEASFTTPPKPRRRSKTYWANGVLLALAAAELHWSVLQPLLPVNVYQLFAFLLPVMNFVLREFTHSGVGAVRQPPPAKPADPERWKQ